MAFTYGFYNSVNHDRRYDAEQFGHMFDGIITDGIFPTIGDRFQVKPRSGMTVTVGTGRAWFNLTWSWNDTLMVLTIPAASSVYDRVDAVVLEVDRRKTVRKNRIFVKVGSNGTTPPTMTKDDDQKIWQYPLAYIKVRRGSTSIVAGDIESRVGTEDAPTTGGMSSGGAVNAIKMNEYTTYNADTNGTVNIGKITKQITTRQGTPHSSAYPEGIMQLDPSRSGIIDISKFSPNPEAPFVTRSNSTRMGGNENPRFIRMFFSYDAEAWSGVGAPNYPGMCDHAFHTPDIALYQFPVSGSAGTGGKGIRTGDLEICVRPGRKSNGAYDYTECQLDLYTHINVTNPGYTMYTSGLVVHVANLGQYPFQYVFNKGSATVSEDEEETPDES